MISISIAMRGHGGLGPQFRLELAMEFAQKQWKIFQEAGLLWTESIYLVVLYANKQQITIKLFHVWARAQSLTLLLLKPSAADSPPDYAEGAHDAPQTP